MTHLIRRLVSLFFNYQNKLMYYYRIGRWFREHGIPILPLMMENRIKRKFACWVSLSAVIADSVRFPHPTGIVIGVGASIGPGTVVFQQVTLGGRQLGDGKKNLYPQVGSNCTIFAGAKILGGVTIGDGATIGANAVVLVDVPAGRVAVGIPARIL